MRWKIVTHYQPFISQKKRTLLVGFLVAGALLCTIIEYVASGLTPRFYLYAGFALVQLILQWRHFNMPTEISLLLENGRLEYFNAYTQEKQTVYQSRTLWRKETVDDIVFFAESSIATKIPIKYFNEQQVMELKTQIAHWGEKKPAIVILP